MINMPRIDFRLAACVAVLTLFGACQKKGSPQPPNPTTRALAAAIAATPVSDPSLPSTVEIAAAFSEASAAAH